MSNLPEASQDESAFQRERLDALSDTLIDSGAVTIALALRELSHVDKITLQLQDPTYRANIRAGLAFQLSVQSDDKGNNILENQAKLVIEDGNTGDSFECAINRYKPQRFHPYQYELSVPYKDVPPDHEFAELPAPVFAADFGVAVEREATSRSLDLFGEPFVLYY